MKKTVNVLIMEPKNILMDLTKKAIEAKPDENYNIAIVGTATTAKGGYFELYKHRPHVLFLNPELEDEEGLSFIRHALERMPYLKIVVMATRLLDEQTYLDGGAHAVIHVPIQRASLWRRIDQLIKEVDSIGLLDVSEYVPENEPITTPEGDLFEIELEERPEYTPIFEEMRSEAQEKEVEVLEEEEEESKDFTPIKVTETVESDDFVVIEDKITPDNSSRNDELLVVDDEEPAVINLIEVEGSSTVDVDSSEELLVFDPFSMDTHPPLPREEQPEVEEEVSYEDLIPFTAHPIEPLKSTSQETEEPEEEPSTTEHNDFSSFKFETETETVVDVNEVIPKELPEKESKYMDEQSSNEPEIPLFDVEPNPSEGFSVEFTEFKEDSLPTEPIIQRPEEELVYSPTTHIPFTPDLEETPLTKPTEQLFRFEDSEVEHESLEVPPVEEAQPVYQESSNKARTKKSLYFEELEYNKQTLKTSRSFDAGFYNREGGFVPLYPPRELFARNEHGNFSKADVDLTESPIINTPQKSKPEEGLFSSVKKLFRRR